MDDEQSSPRPHLSKSHLFTVRVWFGEGVEGWRARAQHVLSGETRYVENCQSLIDFFRNWQHDKSGDANGPAARQDSSDGT